MRMMTTPRVGSGLLVALLGALLGCGAGPDEGGDPPAEPLGAAPAGLTSETIWVGTGDASHVDRTNAILRFDATHTITTTTCGTVTSPTMTLELNGNASSFKDSSSRPIIFPHGLSKGPGDQLFVAGTYTTHDVATRLNPNPVTGKAMICNPANETDASVSPPVSCPYTDYDVGSIALLGGASTITAGPQTAVRDIYGADLSPSPPGVDKPGLDQPHAIYFDAAHNDVYVANAGRDDSGNGRDILVFKVGQDGNVLPSRRIPMALGDIPISVHYDATTDRLVVGFMRYPTNLGSADVQIWENAHSLCAGGCTTAVWPDHIFLFNEVISAGSLFIHNAWYDSAHDHLWVADHTEYVYRYDIGTELTSPSSFSSPGSSPYCRQYTTASYTGSTWTCQGSASVTLRPSLVFGASPPPGHYHVAGLFLAGDRLYASVGSQTNTDGQAIAIYDGASSIASGTGASRTVCYNAPGSTATMYPPQPLVVQTY